MPKDKKPDKKNDGTRARIGPVRLSYCYEAEPKHDPKAKKDYFSTQIMVPESDTETRDILKKIVQRATVAKFGIDKAKQLLKNPNFKKPVRSGNKEGKEEEYYKDMLFFNTTKKEKRPALALRNGKKDLTVDEIADNFYSGVWVYAVVNAYYFENESKGIAIGLNSMMKWKDDDRLDGFSNVEEDFGDMFDEDFDDDGDDDLDLDDDLDMDDDLDDDDDFDDI